MVRVSCLLASCVLIALLLVVPSSAYPSESNYYGNDVQYEPAQVENLIDSLENLVEMERKVEKIQDLITSKKRAFDVGLGRGYSGALQAKHLMALAAANFAGGPGRRRRNAQ